VSWRTLETVGWFALYIGLIAFVLLWNSAPAFYREIFIERSISDWVPDGTRDYVPGTTIAGNELNAVFAGGWWTPQGELRWSKGKFGRVLLRPTRALPTGSRLVATVSALPVWFGPPRELSIGIDGQIVEQRSLGPDPQRIEVPVPAAVAAGDELEITFAIDRVQTPQSVGASDGAMGVGVALHEFAVLAPP